MTAESLTTPQQEKPEVSRLRLIESSVELGARAVRPVIPPIIEWGPVSRDTPVTEQAPELIESYDTFTD